MESITSAEVINEHKNYIDFKKIKIFKNKEKISSIHYDNSNSMTSETYNVFIKYFNKLEYEICLLTNDEINQLEQQIEINKSKIFI
jgi:hypothetical protein